MLQINNTDQVYMPRNTRCTSILEGPFPSALNDSTSFPLEIALRTSSIGKEQLIRPAF